MSNLFSSINTALRAMLSHQQMIQVIEHNVANANTPGFHRQEAVMRASIPYPPRTFGGTIPGQLGTGVEVAMIRRYNLEFFDGRLRREVAETKGWELQHSALQQVEFTLAETSPDGLLPRLDAFWSGWQALSDDPANMAVRGDLKARAAALADALNWRANALLAMRKDQELAITQRVDEINTLAQQIARLNNEIAHANAAGDQPNDLLDERDRVLGRLAELTGATAALQDDGQALVSIGGHALVVGTSAFALTTTPDPANQNLAKITWADSGAELNLARGEIHGLLAVRDTIIPKQLEGLNTLAYELATRVNTLHRTGYGLNNASNLDFFAPFTSTNYALEISLSSNLDDLANIAAASGPDSPGDNGLAITLANMRNQAVLGGGTLTLNQFYNQQIGDLGLAMLSAENQARDHQSVAEALKTMQESVAGVSLDEEAANLVRAQRTYQAAARLMTALDEMLDKVINGMGIVGR